MDIGLLGQFVVNGLMLGMMYALVAVGFTLFFGVLNVIQFSHGDVLMVGAFAGFATWLGLVALGVASPWVQILAVVAIAAGLMALLGALIARYLVLPLKRAPALNTLLITLMLGTVLRESIRVFYPDGANPKRFPALLPTEALTFGSFTLRFDSAILLLAGLAVIVLIHLVINRTKLGLAIRAVAQDEETARTMGINFTAIVLVTFAIGSARGRVRRGDERAVLQRDQLRHRPPARRDRLQRSDRRRPRQHLRRDPGRLSVRRSADGGRGRSAVRERVQGRVRVCRGDRDHGLAADRLDRRGRERAGLSARRCRPRSVDPNRAHGPCRSPGSRRSSR